MAHQISNGVPGAFAAFVDTYGPRLHALARRYTACESDAEDLTQEIFVALFRSIANFRGESTLATWSYRVALNHCLKHASKPRPVTVPYDDTLNLADTAEHGPVQYAARRELNDELQAALNGLSEAHREIVILHELHELTYAECAAVLQVPVGTIKSRLSTAFRRLRSSLSGYVLSDTLPESAP
ncbi:MAG: RNA polymerase sigma factor [Janthinobacterium lividum]